MKVLVMAAGAVGGYFGGMLARAAEDVTFVARGEHGAAIARSGLRVESVAAGDFTVRSPAVGCPDGSWKADLVLFCVKSYDNAEAIDAVRPAVGERTVVLTLQNGVGAGDQLSAAFGADKVLLGAAYIEAKRKAPGVVAQVGGPCRIVFGENDGAESARACRVRDAFQRAGVDVALSRDVSKELWNKLVFICALSGMTCIARATFAEVLEHAATRELTRRVMDEVTAVGRAMGVRLDAGIVETTMARFDEFRAELVSSMYLDLEAGNPLELDVINGAVSRWGKSAGVPTPVNDFITACLGVADARGRVRSG